MYKQECNEWIRKPIAEQSWPNFKAHFLEAQRIQNLQNRSAQQGGFHGANATIEKERMCNAEALANLATAVSADREAFAKLTASLNNYKLKTGHSRKTIRRTVKMELDIARSNLTTVNVDIAGLMDSGWRTTTTVKRAVPKPMVTKTMQPRRTQWVEVPIPIDEVRRWQV
jgi:hypothetical protein